MDIGNWIQAIVTLISSLVIVCVTVRVNKKNHYDQEWWNVKVKKYEECISNLSDIEEYYLIRTRNIEGEPYIKTTNELEDRIKFARDKTIAIANIADLYFDSASIKSINEVKEAFYNQDACIEVSQGDDWNEIAFDLHEVAKKSKIQIIQSAKKELKLGK